MKKLSIVTLFMIIAMSATYMAFGSRLPVPGFDDDVYGTILNDYLLVSHDNDGTLSSDSVLADNINASDGDAIRAKLNLYSTAEVDIKDAEVKAYTNLTALHKSGGVMTGELTTAGHIVNSRSVSSNYTTFTADEFIGVTTGSGGVTVTLKSDDISNAGKLWTIQKEDAATGKVTIGTEGSETINGAAFAVLSSQYERATIVSDGTNVVASIPSVAVITSGTYTPAGTIVTNLDSIVSISDAKYIQVGNVINVSGRISVDPTAASRVDFSLTLPVASAFTDAEQGSGTLTFSKSASDYGTGQIASYATSGEMLFTFLADGFVSTTIRYIYQYEIL
jgi:hypothetical protein